MINRINTQGGGVLPTLPLVGVNTGAGEVTGGAIAGETTEVGGAIASGVATTGAEQTPQPRGRIALADLLAAMPSVTGSLEDDNSLSSTSTEEGAGDVMGTSTKRGLALAVASISERTKLSTGGVYALFVLIVAFVVLSGVIGRRYYVLRKAESAPKK